MYEEFYGITENPFTLTADPKYLYLSESHEEGLAHLLYGVERKKGLIVLTGEIGTGKTTLLSSLVQRLDTRHHIAFLVNSHLSTIDIFHYAFHKFGLETRGKSKGELLIELEDFLLRCSEAKEHVVLIMDEAQNSSHDVLEELRFLTNIESPQEKLLQIILSGQPTLDAKLNLPELAQLKQRRGISYRLRALDYHETQSYIEKRLAVAGAAHPIFTEEAIDDIYVHSKGIPRVINLMGDLALFFGCADKQRQVGRPIIQHVVESMQGAEPVPQAAHHGGHKHDEDRADAIVVKQAIRVMPDLPKLADDSASPEPASTSPARRRLRRPAVVAIAAGMVFSLVIGGVWARRSDTGTAVIDWVVQSVEHWLTAGLSITRDPLPPLPDSTTALPTKAAPDLPRAVQPSLDDGMRQEPDSVKSTLNQPSTGWQNSAPGVSAPRATNAEGATGEQFAVRSTREPTDKEGSIDLESVLHILTGSGPGPQTGEGVAEKLGAANLEGPGPAPQVVIVQAGDTLAKLMRRAYGQFDDDLLALVQKANPDLTDISLIEVGQEIVLPPLPKPSSHTP